MGGVCSVGVVFCINVFLLFLSRFDCLNGKVECVLRQSTSYVGMVTTPESCVNVMVS